LFNARRPGPEGAPTGFAQAQINVPEFVVVLKKTWSLANSYLSFRTGPPPNRFSCNALALFFPSDELSSLWLLARVQTRKWSRWSYFDEEKFFELEPLILAREDGPRLLTHRQTVD
jgi:hypothetical protein